MRCLRCGVMGHYKTYKKEGKPNEGLFGKWFGIFWFSPTERPQFATEPSEFCPSCCNTETFVKPPPFVCSITIQGYRVDENREELQSLGFYGKSCLYGPMTKLFYVPQESFLYKNALREKFGIGASPKYWPENTGVFPLT